MPSGATTGDHEKAQFLKTEVACWIVLLAAAIGTLIWRHCTVFFLSWTDEQIHFYVAHRMAEGAVLYRDIESARPPLVLFPIACLIKVGCSPLLAGRAVVLASQITTAGLLLWGGRLVSWRAGILAALLFLTSPEAFSQIHYTGIHLAALTTAACVLFSLKARPLWAGMLLGLSFATDQHGLVICCIVALLTVFRRPRDAFAFAGGALLVCAIVFGGVWAMGGRHLWESLVGIHLFHLRIGRGANAQFWERFAPWLYEHGYLFMGSALAITLLVARRAEIGNENPTPPSSRVVRVLILVVGAHIAVVLAMTEAAFLYVVVVVPLLALLAGIGLDGTVAWWRQRRQLSQVQAHRASRLVATGAVAVLVLTAVGWSAASSHRERLDERPYSFWPHVLHGQVSRFHRLDVALREIGESMLPKDGTIFGDPTIVSALALHNGLRVSGELADMNPNWIEAGTVRPEEVVSRIERDGVAAVVSPPWGLPQNPYFKSYLLACYQKPKPYLPPQNGPGEGLPFLLVFTRIHSNTPCQVLPP
jgi:hypothetical protein